MEFSKPVEDPKRLSVPELLFHKGQNLLALLNFLNGPQPVRVAHHTAVAKWDLDAKVPLVRLEFEIFAAVPVVEGPDDLASHLHIIIFKISRWLRLML